MGCWSGLEHCINRVSCKKTLHFDSSFSLFTSLFPQTLCSLSSVFFFSGSKVRWLATVGGGAAAANTFFSRFFFYGFNYFSTLFSFLIPKIPNLKPKPLDLEKREKKLTFC